MMNKYQLSLLLSLCVALLFSGCGGGGGGSSGSSVTIGIPGQTSSSSSSSSSGSSSGGNSFTVDTQSPTYTSTDNTVAVTVSRGLFKIPNIPVVSVTLCVPGTTQCQTIDNIQVDTGSYGLRIVSSVISLPLPPITAVNGNSLFECASFASGYSWGPIETADITIGNKVVSNLPIQIINDPTKVAAPSSCTNQGAQLATAQDVGANGILGVGIFAQDCGATCVTGIQSGPYYSCTDSSCTYSAAPLAQQMTNPVSMFASDNNGVILQMPQVADGGTSSVTGTLTFGIGTRANNQLQSAQIYTANSRGYITTQFNGQTLPNSFIDSGSNAFFFDFGNTPICQEPNAPFYCPATTQQLTATNIGQNGVRGIVNFAIANSNVIFSTPGAFALNNLGSSSIGQRSFDWGMPFFYGRTVYFALENRQTPAGVGPYFAY